MRSHFDKCRGMTLIELLVVVMILGLLAAATAPLLSSSSGRRGREAAAMVATMATRANGYARQLPDSSELAGLYIAPLSPRDYTASSQPDDGSWDQRPPPASADLSVAGGQHDYKGDVAEAAAFCVYKYPATAPRQAIFAFRKTECRTLPGRMSNHAILSVDNQASAVRLISPPMDLKDATPSIPIGDYGNYWFLLATAMSADDSFDTIEGAGGKNFSLSMPPVQALPAGLKMVGEYVIDIGWSTCGRKIFRPITDPMPLGVGVFVGIPFFDQYSPLLVQFNNTGNLMRCTFTRWNPVGRYPAADFLNSTDAVYLLVGKVDRAGFPYRPTPTNREPGANWQYSDSRWVRINGNGGTVLIADPVPNAPNVFSSQGYARRGISSSRP